MIKITQPYVLLEENSAILESYIYIDNEKHKVWFKVDINFKDFLCYERSDAFVIAVLNFAMRYNHDIECEAPISEELFYNLDKYFIDALKQSNKHFYRTKIFAEISTEYLPCAGAVGTGISCGVDSLHSIASQTELKFIRHNITHLTFNNVGSHGEGNIAEKLYKERIEQSKKFAEEYGFVFVASNSNLADVIKQSHFKTHTYSSMFPVYCLQKLFSIFYYASGGYRYNEYTLIDSQNICSGAYENFSLPLFSIKNLRIYSEGEGMTRMTKLKHISDFKPSYKYLNVCLKTKKNCGKCEKCIRTLLGLDAIGVLEKYKEVFDVEYYYKNKQWYLKQMLLQIANNKHDYFEIYPFIKKQIYLSTIFCSLLPFLFIRINNKIPKGKFRNILKFLLRRSNAE